MPHTLSLELRQKPSQNIKQLQHLIMSRQMQQAIHFLQIPVMELQPLVELELEQNPVLEYIQNGDVDQERDTGLEQLEEEMAEEIEDQDPISEEELVFADTDLEIMKRLDEDFRNHFSESGSFIAKASREEEELRIFLESSIKAPVTLFEYLTRQAHEAFDDAKQLEIAEELIGNLDRSGFISVPLEEIALLKHCSLAETEKILSVIQTFDPAGVAARDLKESLLIQLRLKGKEKSLAYRIVADHFADLLHNRILLIKKALSCTEKEVAEAIDSDIAKLDLHPATQLSICNVPYIVPDALIRQEEEELHVSVNDDTFPPLRLNSRYLRMLDDDTLSNESKEFIRQKVVSAKWLMRNILQRNTTLEKIVGSIAKKQHDYFVDPNGELAPLIMKTLADELEMHESTVARAVANKYADTPRGILPLRSFFTSALPSQKEGEISSHTARSLINKMIAEENKKKPLSDEVLSKLLKAKGILCARRTVAKYRMSLKIGNAQQRRKY